MSGTRLVVVGDVINDVVVVPRGPIRTDTDTAATIRPKAGGSAANTAVWAGSLGAAVDLVAAVGTYDLDWHVEQLEEHGVVPHLQVEPGIPTGTIVLIVQGEDRSMLTERGANAALRADRVTDGLLAGAGVLHVSGYSILDGFSERDTRGLVERSEAFGVPLSVNPASVGYLADFGVERFLRLIDGATAVFPNLAEGRLLSGEHEPEAVVAALSDRFPVVPLTLGAAGVLVGRRGRAPVHVPSPQVQLIDPTGAGDAFTAAFLERWVATGDAVAGAQAGVLLAARAVMTIGGRPPI